MPIKYVTEERLFSNSYDTMDRQRELLSRMITEMPNDQMAIMPKAKAAEYLGVNRGTLERYERRGILRPIVNQKNGYRYYYLGHLWVFKTLWFESRDNGDGS